MKKLLMILTVPVFAMVLEAQPARIGDGVFNAYTPNCFHSLFMPPNSSGQVQCDIEGITDIWQDWYTSEAIAMDLNCQYGALSQPLGSGAPTNCMQGLGPISLRTPKASSMSGPTLPATRLCSVPRHTI